MRKQLEAARKSEEVVSWQLHLAATFENTEINETQSSPLTMIQKGDPCHPGLIPIRFISRPLQFPPQARSVGSSLAGQVEKEASAREEGAAAGGEELGKEQGVIGEGLSPDLSFFNLQRFVSHTCCEGLAGGSA